MQDALTLLGDDCGRDSRGSALISRGILVVGKPPIRQQLLADRGYIVRYGGAFKAQCRFMQLLHPGMRFVAGTPRLVQDPETELRSLKPSAVATPVIRRWWRSGNQELLSNTRSTVSAKGQKLRWLRSEALQRGTQRRVEVECRATRCRLQRSKQITRAWDAGGGGMNP